MRFKLKQKNVPWIGAVVDSLYTSLPVLSIINFLAITTVLYATVREHLFRWVPWLTYYWFLLILVVLTVSLMTVIYLVVLPSLWTFRNKQMNKFESVLLEEVRKLNEKPDTRGDEAVLTLAKELLDFAWHGDYANGNDFYSSDEGRHHAQGALEEFEKRLEALKEGEEEK